MDTAGANVNDAPYASHRQSILGNFLRVRPRGSSQSHQAPPQLPFNTSTSPPDLDSHNHPDVALNTTNYNMFNQPPSPGPNAGHRRRPAANGLQASVSNGFNAQPNPPTPSSVFPHLLRRRRSANGALPVAPGSQQGQSGNVVAPSVDLASPVLAVRPSATNNHRIRLVPQLDSNRSLHFDPISRDVKEGDPALRIGRFTDRSGMGMAALNAQNSNKLAFKSKVVSRAHAEIWCDVGGKFFIKDTKSSSGTFLNHIRLAAPNQESRQFALKDGDVLQLGVDYQGGTDDIYKCVKMRIELGREWQNQANAFNTNALKQLKMLSAPNGKPTTQLSPGTKSSLSDCCICLFSVSVRQSLFIAPCSHVYHYKCIRPLLIMHHPGFSCPLCRTFANLEEDVEVDAEPEMDIDDAETGEGSGGSGVDTDTRAEMRASVRMEADVDPVAVANVSAVLSAALNEAAANETEVEADFVPNSSRRVSGTLRNRRVSPSHHPGFEDVLEHADEHEREEEHELDADAAAAVRMMMESEDDDGSGGDLPEAPRREPHELHALPVPTPSMRLAMPPSHPGNANAGSPISRPMSVPIHSSMPMQGLGIGYGSGMPMRGTTATQPILVDDFSDAEDGAMHGLEGLGDELANGSKRKR